MAVRGWAPELGDFPTAVGSAFTAGRGRSRASLAGLTRQVADHAHLEDAAKQDLLVALQVTPTERQPRSSPAVCKAACAHVD